MRIVHDLRSERMARETPSAVLEIRMHPGADGYIDYACSVGHPSSVEEERADDLALQGARDYWMRQYDRPGQAVAYLPPRELAFALVHSIRHRVGRWLWEQP